MTATDPTTAQPATPGQALATGWTVEPPPGHPTNPGEALRMVAERLAEDGPAFDDSRTAHAYTLALLEQWADELDAAPATYALPAEPPPEVTELWDLTGYRWERQQPYGWCRDGQHDDATWCRWPWFGLLDHRGPLSTVPPAGTEGDQ